MSDGRAWEGHWKVRLYERLRERGYDSLTAFAEARPTDSLVALAEELGKEDIAGVQVLSGLLAEAEQRKQVTRFVRDVLVRMLSQSLPEGWPTVLDDANRFKVAKAIGRWARRQSRRRAPGHAASARVAPARPRRRVAAHAPARRGSLTSSTALSTHSSGRWG